MTFSRKTYAVGSGLLVVVLLATVAVVLLSVNAQKSVTVFFPQAVNLYPDDEVRVLGVKVGTIASVEPLGDQVKVVADYSDDLDIPADANAAVISPSLVGVRYVQLGPAYTGGPAMPDDGVIPIDRTAVPAEWDEIKDQVNALAAALGPQSGAAGPLARTLDTTSANLGGQGPAVNETVTKLSEAIRTITDGRQDLFATVRNLQVFVSALRESDAQVDQFNRQLALVSGVLDENRQALATTLATIDRATPIIEGFVRDNRGQVTADVQALTRVVQNVAANRQGLADVLQRAPAPVSNLGNIIDERTGGILAALSATNLNDPAAFVCDTAAAAAPGGANDPAAANLCRQALGGLLDFLRVSTPPISANPVETQSSGPGAGVAGSRTPSLSNLLVPGGR